MGTAHCTSSFHCQPHTVPVCRSWELQSRGRVALDGTKMEPRWNQDGTKMEPRWNQDGTKMEPRWNSGKVQRSRCRLLVTLAYICRPARRWESASLATNVTTESNVSNTVMTEDINQKHQLFCKSSNGGLK
jgi:hypothetical protein